MLEFNTTINGKVNAEEVDSNLSVNRRVHLNAYSNTNTGGKVEPRLSCLIGTWVNCLNYLQSRIIYYMKIR